jgi:hypothetical protein
MAGINEREKKMATKRKKRGGRLGVGGGHFIYEMKRLPVN